MPTERRLLQGVEFAQNVVNARYACPVSNHLPGEFVFISGYEECTERFDLIRDSYPYLTLEMIIKGRGNLTLNGKHISVSPGLCFCTGPGASFRLKASKGSPFTKYFVAFGRSANLSITQKSRLYPGFVYDSIPPTELEKWNELILEEGASQLSPAAENAAALIDILIKKIAPNTKTKPRETSADALVQRALRQIEREFQILKSLQDLADSLKVSGEHLCRVFKASGKASPYQILTRRKMEHAYAQLKMTQTPIQEIASSLGFTDAFHFSRAFKKRYGIPPSHTRFN